MNKLQMYSIDTDDIQDFTHLVNSVILTGCTDEDVVVRKEIKTFKCFSLSVKAVL